MIGCAADMMAHGTGCGSFECVDDRQVLIEHC